MQYQLEHCTCDLCGSIDYTVIWDKEEREKQGKLYGAVIRDDNGKIINGRNVMCNKCGLAYVTPRMTRETLKEFYEKEYRNIYDEEVNFKSELRHAENLVNLLNTYKIKGGTFLDIGSSVGVLVAMLSQNGVDAIGIEASKRNADIAIKNGVNVINTNIEEWQTDKKFDVITMLNTLEHMYSPKEILKKIHSMLSDEGVLIISVPDLFNINIKRNPDVYLSNAHIYNFNVYSLGKMLVECGYEPKHVDYTPEEIGNKLYMTAQKTTKDKEELLEPIPNKTNAQAVIELLEAIDNVCDKAVKL